MVWKPDVRIKTVFASGSASSSASAPEAALPNFVTPAVAAPPVGAQSVEAEARFENFKVHYFASRTTRNWEQAAARKWEQAAYSTGVFVAPEDPWSDPADPYPLVHSTSDDTDTEDVPDPVTEDLSTSAERHAGSEEIVAKRTESEDEEEAWAKAVANDPSEDLSPDGGQHRTESEDGEEAPTEDVSPDGGQHDDIDGACWKASDDIVEDIEAVQSPPEPTRPQLAESVATTEDLGRRCKARPQPRPHPPLPPPPKHLFGT